MPQWTEEVIDLTISLHDDGMSFAEIAAELSNLGFQATRGSVAGKLYRLGKLGAKKPARAITVGGVSVSKQRSPNRPANLKRIKELMQEVLPMEEEPDAIYGRTLMELTSRSCRWPQGDPKQPSFRFCGKTRITKSAYCKEHSQKAYRVPDRFHRAA